MPTINKLPLRTTILGFTGSIGSGCSYIAKRLAANHGYEYFCLSDYIKKIAHDEGLRKPTVEQQQDIGNRLRKKKKSFLAEQLIKEIPSLIKSGKLDLSTKRGIIVDSIRNDKEVETLRQFPFFYLFSVHADEDIRQKRTLADGKFSTSDEFKAADKRDKEEKLQHGQQVKKCNDLADIIINNNRQFPTKQKKDTEEFIFDIHSKYISLIESVKEDEPRPPDLKPSFNETLMTMAYAESRLSSCLKRKVGAIVASINIAAKATNDNAVNETFRIVSSGHNEVPLGTVPCAYNPESNEVCHRDFLKERFAKKILCCPNCGREIKANFKCTYCKEAIKHYAKNCPKCKREIELDYKCPKCKKMVFSEYIENKDTGKLLDVCRALHAEEVALLNLSKAAQRKEDTLVLYTSTFPCTLCANKIVAAGIDKVMYAEPYPMKDAIKTLIAGNVEVEKFEGIKSSAYFKLYKQ